VNENKPFALSTHKNSLWETIIHVTQQSSGNVTYSASREDTQCTYVMQEFSRICLRDKIRKVQQLVLHCATMIATCSPRNFDHRLSARCPAHFHFRQRYCYQFSNIPISRIAKTRLRSPPKQRDFTGSVKQSIRKNSFPLWYRFRTDRRANCPFWVSATKKCHSSMPDRCRKNAGNRRRHRVYVYSPFVRAAIVHGE